MPVPVSVLEQAEAELRARQQAALAKIAPLRDLIVYYENQSKLCQDAADAIAAILAADPSSLAIDLGNPAHKGAKYG